MVGDTVPERLGMRMVGEEEEDTVRVALRVGEVEGRGEGVTEGVSVPSKPYLPNSPSRHPPPPLPVALGVEEGEPPPPPNSNTPPAWGRGLGPGGRG